MANKREREKRARENVALQYKKSTGKLLPFYGWAIAVLAAVIVCYFFNWVYVYNSDYGIEVKASGFSFIAAALSGKYYSADKIYGDLAMPFYYYAESSCETLGAVTLTAFILIILTIIVLIIAIITKLQGFSFVSVALSLTSSIMLIVTFIVALGMKNDKILSVYCGGNPKCTIGSSAVLPAVLAICATAVQWFAARKLNKIYKEYNDKIAKL